MTKLEIMKLKAEIANLERVAERAEPSIAVAMRQRAAELRQTVEAADSRVG